MAKNAGERAMAAASQLEKIGFVDFTVDLVKGVYDVIVKASLDQLKAYADLVNQVSKDLATYQTDMIGADGSPELTAKVDSYISEVLELDPKSITPFSLTKEQSDDLTTHFSGIENSAHKKFTDVLTPPDPAGGNYTLEINDLKEFVEAKLKAGVKHSQDLLKTILKIGMQKVVVTNGEIETKLTFHIDASDSSSRDSQKTKEKASRWGVSGAGSGSILGGTLSGSLSGGYSSRKLSVSVVNEKSSAATNIQIDILGHVRILFRTETFPSADV